MGQTITLPGGKTIPKRPALILGGSAAVFVLWRYWAAAGSAPAAADQDTTSDGVMDLTGATSDGGLGMAGGSTVGDRMPWSSIGAGYTDPTTEPAATNQSWYTRSLEFLASLGYDPKVAGETLGRYLARTALPADTAAITAAIGYAGTPPVGDYGYPTILPVSSTPPRAGTTPTVTPAAPVVTLPASSPVKVTPAKPNTSPGWGWFTSLSARNTLGSIAAKYTQSPGETLQHAVADLIALNPSLRGRSAASKVAVNTRLKVRAGAGPYVPAK